MVVVGLSGRDTVRVNRKKLESLHSSYRLLCLKNQHRMRLKMMSLLLMMMNMRLMQMCLMVMMMLCMTLHLKVVMCLKMMLDYIRILLSVKNSSYDEGAMVILFVV